jgi:hypothetical protein
VIAVDVAAVGGNVIEVGGTKQFTSAAWASSNTVAASVSNTGVATGLAVGNSDISATHQGRTGSATLQVTAPAVVQPMARFTVSGPGGNDVCRIIVGSGGDLDCTFDGSASTGGSGGAVTQWTWRYDVGANSQNPVNRSVPTHTPQNLCGFFDDQPDEEVAGTGFVQMIVKLEVQNAAGTGSLEVRNMNVRLFPREQCGFGF